MHKLASMDRQGCHADFYIPNIESVDKNSMYTCQLKNSYMSEEFGLDTIMTTAGHLASML